MFWFFLFFGIFLIAIGVYVIWATGQCKKEIKGVYIKANRYSGGKARGAGNLLRGDCPWNYDYGCGSPLAD